MSIFNKIQLPKIGSSTFNLSHERKFSMNMGDLVPMLVQECVPGDHFKINTQQMLRMLPMVAPVMHDVNVFTHFFFVPNRILWKNWEKFITGGEDGLSTNLIPQVNLAGTGVMTDPNSVPDFNYRLADYLGLPQKPVEDAMYFSQQNVSILPFLAYQKIYNDYYRDQNLIESLDSLFDSVKDGINEQFYYNSENWAEGGIEQIFGLRKRAWQHDYFTSCLPFAQKGQPVRLPLGTKAPINYKYPAYNNSVNTLTGHVDVGELRTDSDGDLTHTDDLTRKVFLDNSGNLEADLSEAVSATVNDLRRAFSLQEWLEKNARAGSRYVESILSHFGVRSSDARLQRPEYIGGGMSPIMISEVLQTSETNGSPQGNMSGHGVNLGNNGGVSKFCEEHGYIIGIVSVMPKTAYQQGIPRHWQKFDKFDHFWPSFEHIGEQAVLNRELILTTKGRDNEVFGYIPRYSEYKFNPSTVHGYFKSNLDFWHMGRIFDKVNPPNLNQQFINANPTRRIFAIEDEKEDTLLVQMFHNIQARRKMKYFSNPSRII